MQFFLYVDRWSIFDTLCYYHANILSIKVSVWKTSLKLPLYNTVPSIGLSFFVQPIAAECWLRRMSNFREFLKKNTIFDEHPVHTYIQQEMFSLFIVVLYAKDEGSRFDESLAEPFQMELHQHVACLLATRLSANWRAKIYANIL